jgi:hypothetical protein
LKNLPRTFFDHSRHKLQHPAQPPRVERPGLPGQGPSNGLTDADGYTERHYGLDPQHFNLFFE